MLLYLSNTDNLKFQATHFQCTSFFGKIISVLNVLSFIYLYVLCSECLIFTLPQLSIFRCYFLKHIQSTQLDKHHFKNTNVYETVVFYLFT